MIRWILINLFGWAGDYSKIILTTLSLASLGGLHLYVVRELLLGSLSPLADPAFFLDIATDLSFFFVSSSLAARMIYLLLFTGFVNDQIAVVERLYSIGSRGYKKLFGKEFLKIHSGLISAEFERNSLAIQVLFGSVFFITFYVGWPSSVVIMLAAIGIIIVWIILMSQVFRQFGISVRDLIDVDGVIDDPKKAGTVLSVLVTSLLLLAILSAHGRALKLFNSNTVNLTSEDRFIGCVNILGKSSSGIFYAPVDPMVRRTYYMPFSAIKLSYDLDGADLPWDSSSIYLSC